MANRASRLHYSIVVALFVAAGFVAASGTFAQGGAGLLMRAKMRGHFRQGGSSGQAGSQFGMKQNGAIAEGYKNFWYGQGTMERKTMMSDGLERHYYVYTPKTLSAQGKAPVVLAFHGGGGTPEGDDRVCAKWTLASDKSGFLLVFPEGLERHWNDGRVIPGNKNHDDVGFISKVIDDLVSSYRADPQRVYATGISNGGFFSQYLATMLPGRIAAVASVAASVSTALNNFGAPVPIILILGTKDTLIPWEGGTIGGNLLPHSRGRCLSGRESVKSWLARNRNTNAADTRTLPDVDTSDDSRVSIEQYGADGAPNEVVLILIDGGGHTWPNGQQYLPKKLVGPVCKDFDANEYIFQFFMQHPAIQKES